MAAGVRRGRLDLGPLRRRDFSRARVLLLCVQALGREADRGRLVLPVDHPAGLGLRLLDRAGRRRAYPAHLRPPTRPDQRAAGTLGRPRRHGTRFALSDTASAPVPTAELSVQDKRHGKVHVSSWTGLHPKLGCRGRWANNDHPPIVAGTVIRVDVEHLPKPSPSPLKTLWLWWSGPGEPDLDLCWRAYLRRFDIEIG